MLAGIKKRFRGGAAEGGVTAAGGAPAAPMVAADAGGEGGGEGAPGGLPMMTMKKGPPRGGLGIEKVPNADPMPAHNMSAPHGGAVARARERRRSSVARDAAVIVLADLPPLKDALLGKREELFKQKLDLCCVIFNFDSPESNKRGKELKRATLLEIVDYVQV